MGEAAGEAVYVALLRGVNVGGKNALPMAELREALRSLGARRVETYLQSGNAVFRRAGDAGELPRRLAEAIRARRGFTPQVLLLGREELGALLAANPFPEAEAEPKTLHLYVLEAPPAAPDLEALRRLARPSERFRLVGRAFYLHAPEGVGRSKLAAQAERRLGVSATARNWRTMAALLALARAA